MAAGAGPPVECSEGSQSPHQTRDSEAFALADCQREATDGFLPPMPTAPENNLRFLARSAFRGQGPRRTLHRHLLASQLCVSTGRVVVATRFSFDYGWYRPEDEMRL